MILGVVYIVLPAAIYGVLAFLPSGRAAATGFGLVGGAILALWVADVWDLGPFFSGDEHADAQFRFAVILYAAAFGLAAVAQGLRHWLAGRGRIAYLAVAAGLFAAAALPALMMLGV